MALHQTFLCNKHEIYATCRWSPGCTLIHVAWTPSAVCVTSSKPIAYLRCLLILIFNYITLIHGGNNLK